MAKKRPTSYSAVIHYDGGNDEFVVHELETDSLYINGTATEGCKRLGQMIDAAHRRAKERRRKEANRKRKANTE